MFYLPLASQPNLPLKRNSVCGCSQENKPVSKDIGGQPSRPPLSLLLMCLAVLMLVAIAVIRLTGHDRLSQLLLLPIAVLSACFVIASFYLWFHGK